MGIVFDDEGRSAAAPWYDHHYQVVGVVGYITFHGPRLKLEEPPADPDYLVGHEIWLLPDLGSRSLRCGWYTVHGVEGKELAVTGSVTAAERGDIVITKRPHARCFPDVTSWGKFVGGWWPPEDWRREWLAAWAEVGWHVCVELLWRSRANGWTK
jgi:hypothetical protein